MNSFLHGKKTLPLVSLRPPAGLAAPQAPGRKAARLPSVASAGAPTANVETVKEGDKVVRLIVTCACGERVEIDCLYPAGS